MKIINLVLRTIYFSLNHVDLRTALHICKPQCLHKQWSTVWGITQGRFSLRPYLCLTVIRDELRGSWTATRINSCVEALFISNHYLQMHDTSEGLIMYTRLLIPGDCLKITCHLLLITRHMTNVSVVSGENQC